MDTEPCAGWSPDLRCIVLTLGRVSIALSPGDAIDLAEQFELGDPEPLFGVLVGLAISRGHAVLTMGYTDLEAEFPEELSDELGMALARDLRAAAAMAAAAIGGA